MVLVVEELGLRGRIEIMRCGPNGVDIVVDNGYELEVYVLPGEPRRRYRVLVED